ncbi:hypothetical protein JAO74_12045 [Sphingomonas sp. BT553]|uniref:Uncharacterized protein n=2 Tax=Sphingomonas mollis TaxID=2795726 RepID=A0ABS0XR62_9SPHN|nr:hypothetical protein [Sphingomonas sp. BT553]
MVPLTPGPSSLSGQAFEGDRLDMPVVIVSALGATGTRVEDFLARLAEGPIWQDKSIRSTDREVDIQAYLAPEGLRCVIRLARNAFYHHPLGTLHVYGLRRPKISIGDGVPLHSILPDDLLDTIPIMVIGITPLNIIRPDIGISLRVTMPRIQVDVPADGR